MLQKILLLSDVDREDYWVNGFAFEVSSTDYYEESFNEIKDKLFSQEVQEKIADEFCFDLKLNKLISIEWNYAAVFTYECSEENEDYDIIGDVRVITLRPNYIYLVK